MKKQAITCTLTITIILLSLFSAAITQPCNASTESVSNFSIIWITDTQYLSASHPTSFDNLTQWIADNNSTYNIKMVIHTGDIVDTEGNRTQWLNANQSMSILLNNDVPYCWDAGNHDYNDTCWIGNQYAAFNPQTMQAEPYWVSDDYNGMNTAVHFIASGMDWLVVNIAFHANDSVLAWANNLLDANPQSHVIIATHAYIDGPCRYDSWATHLKATVLDRHANVFLTLNGHYHPASASRTQVGGRDELFFNQQDNSSELGADSARILTFDTAKGTINVQTYDPYSNHFLQDNGDNFTLNSAFHSDLVGKNDLMASGVCSCGWGGFGFFCWCGSFCREKP
jgi:hypothetical protein